MSPDTVDTRSDQENEHDNGFLYASQLFHTVCSDVDCLPQSIFETIFIKVELYYAIRLGIVFKYSP